jgi:hypothetical protein
MHKTQFFVVFKPRLALVFLHENGVDEIVSWRAIECCHALSHQELFRAKIIGE